MPRCCAPTQLATEAVVLLGDEERHGERAQDTFRGPFPVRGTGPDLEQLADERQQLGLDAERPTELGVISVDRRGGFCRPGGCAAPR